MKKLVPVIDKTRCIGCEHCVMACPLGVLALVEKKAEVVKADACESEAMCLVPCPTHAIYKLGVWEGRAAA
jgi:Fe-S-cluster-containing hydrogenase component 2